MHAQKVEWPFIFQCPRLSSSAYTPWLVVDWYDFAVVDVLLALFDRFYQKSGVSAIGPSAVRFHFVHSVYGMALGLPVAVVAGLMVLLM